MSEGDNMLGDVINGIIGPIFEATWNSLKTQYYEGLQNTEQEQMRIASKQAIQQASEKYHQNYLDRHCNIKVLPGLMKEPMPLDKIYTAVKFLKDSDLRCFSSLDDLEEQYRQANRRRFWFGTDERQDGLTAANSEQYLMVLGGPGVGKSTFLRKLGLEALANRLVHNLMPVFIELKSFKSEEVSLQQAISKELEVSGFPYAENLVESMLSEGKMMVLFDGLDEVPSKQVDGVIEQIRNFCDRHNQNRRLLAWRYCSSRSSKLE
ncbi:MAG: NACHT domain-containing protein, partial [Cyanobacteria bacterium J06634_6]